MPSPAARTSAAFKCPAAASPARGIARRIRSSRKSRCVDPAVAPSDPLEVRARRQRDRPRATKLRRPAAAVRLGQPPPRGRGRRWQPPARAARPTDSRTPCSRCKRTRAGSPPPSSRRRSSRNDCESVEPLLLQAERAPRTSPRRRVAIGSEASLRGAPSTRPARSLRAARTGDRSRGHTSALSLRPRRLVRGSSAEPVVPAERLRLDEKVARHLVRQRARARSRAAAALRAARL